MDERVTIFIDGANLYSCLREEFGAPRIDFSELVEVLCGRRRLVRTHYYNAVLHETYPDEQREAQGRFLHALSYISYFEVHRGRLEPRGSTYVEKGTDVRLAVDLVTGAFKNQYDTAILVAGDADFVPAVEVVKAEAKHVEVAFGKHGLAEQLRQACDTWVPFDCTLIERIQRD